MKQYNFKIIKDIYYAVLNHGMNVIIENYTISLYYKGKRLYATEGKVWRSGRICFNPGYFARPHLM